MKSSLTYQLLRNSNLSLFLLIYVLVAIGVLHKVINLPMTHDEVGTAVYYINFSYIEIIQFPGTSPNNHVLNSLLTKLSVEVFGNHPWSLRLPNFIAFIGYSYAVFRLLKNILGSASMFFIPAALLFVVSPYFLDFFSLSRGYGLSSAFCLLSVSYIVTGFGNKKGRHIWFGFLFALLACYSNFTLVYFLAAVGLLTFGFFTAMKIPKGKKIINLTLLILVAAGFAFLVVGPITKMQANNEFTYWESNGFIKDTITHLVQFTLSDSKIFLTTTFITQFILFLVSAQISYLLAMLILKRDYSQIRSPLFISTLLLAGTAGINILLCQLLETPNLIGRTALFFFPLFIVSLISTVSSIRSFDIKLLKLSLSVLVTFFAAHHIITMYKADSVKEWSFDANTYDVLDYIKTIEGESSLATHWLFNKSFSYYTDTGKANWLHLAPYNKEIETNSNAEYYYVFEDDFELLKSRYQLVKRYDNRLLLRKY